MAYPLHLLSLLWLVWSIAACLQAEYQQAAGKFYKQSAQANRPVKNLLASLSSRFSIRDTGNHHGRHELAACGPVSSGRPMANEHAASDQPAMVLRPLRADEPNERQLDYYE